MNKHNQLQHFFKMYASTTCTYPIFIQLIPAVQQKVQI